MSPEARERQEKFQLKVQGIYKDLYSQGYRPELIIEYLADRYGRAPSTMREVLNGVSKLQKEVGEVSLTVILEQAS